MVKQKQSRPSKTGRGQTTKRTRTRSAEREPGTDSAGPRDGSADSRGNGSALERSLALLETLLKTDRPLNLEEIGAQLDLPRQSTHRILTQLIELGLLQRHIDRKRFEAGPRLHDLAVETLLQSCRAGTWHPVLQSLAERTGETCHLGVLDRDKVLLLDRVESKWALRLHEEVGKRLGLHSSSIGKLMLAYLPKARRHEYLTARPLERFTAHTIVDEGELESEFAGIRKQGYAISNQGETPGIFDMAVPVRDPQGRILMGIGCQAPLVRLSPERAVTEILPVLRDAAGRMEALVSGDLHGVTPVVGGMRRKGRAAKPVRARSARA